MHIFEIWDYWTALLLFICVLAATWKRQYCWKCKNFNHSDTSGHYSFGPMFPFQSEMNQTDVYCLCVCVTNNYRKFTVQWRCYTLLSCASYTLIFPNSFAIQFIKSDTSPSLWPIECAWGALMPFMHTHKINKYRKGETFIEPSKFV